jgi:hypothetical protein
LCCYVLCSSWRLGLVHPRGTPWKSRTAFLLIPLLELLPFSLLGGATSSAQSSVRACLYAWLIPGLHVSA